MLFSNDPIAKNINNNFEPVWVSVREVPIVHIDFGKGKKLTRTLHGNIATYLCTSDGKVLDILPGIYNQQTYLSCLNQFSTLYNSFQANRKDAVGFMAKYHAAAAGAIERNTSSNTPRTNKKGNVSSRKLSTADFTKSGVVELGPEKLVRRTNTHPKPLFKYPVVENPAVKKSPTAADYTKQDNIELGTDRVVRSTSGTSKPVVKKPVAKKSTAKVDVSKTLVIEKGPSALVRSTTGRPPAPKAPPSNINRVKSDANTIINRTLKASLAEDTRVNENARRLMIHKHLLKVGLVQPEKITKWLYKEVLHADLDDPYLGLGETLFSTYPFRSEDEE